MTGWIAKPIGDVCHIVGGGTPSRSNTTYFGGQIPWATVRDMKSDWIETTEFSITEEAVKRSASNVLPTGTVIVASRVGLGKVCRARRETAINQDLRGFIPKDATTLDRQYLFHWLRSMAARIVAAGTGATVQGVTLPFLKSLQIPLPPLEEQRRIVAVLDEAFAAIATVTANAEKNLANARELFDDFLAAAFEGTDNDWTISTIGETCTLRSGTTVKANLEQATGEIPYLKVADMSHPNNLAEVTTSSRFLRRSDIGRNALIPVGATIFPKRGGAIMTNKKRLIATPIAADLNIMSVIPGERLTARFLNYYFQNVDMRLLGSGSSIPQINNYDIEPLRIAVPDQATQLIFVDKADRLKSEIARLTEIYRSKVIALTQLKQSILRRAFTGELTATAPVANDNSFKTPAFAANVIALAYRRHVAQGTEATFGHVKAQKALHLCESVGQVDMGRNPIKDAAGPNDFQHMLAAEEWAKANKFFDFVPRSNGKGYTFRKLARFETMAADGLAVIKPVHDRLEQAIAPIAQMKSEEAELLATVHAAWNNLILDGVELTDDAIIHEARENWHPAKLKFDRSKFRTAIATIRSKGIIPNGTAKRVGGQGSLF